MKSNKKDKKEKLSNFFKQIERDIYNLDNPSEYIILPNFTANSMIMCHKEYININTLIYYGFQSKKQDEKHSLSKLLGVEIGTSQYDGCTEPKYKIIKRE